MRYLSMRGTSDFSSPSTATSIRVTADVRLFAIRSEVSARAVRGQHFPVALPAVPTGHPVGRAQPREGFAAEVCEGQPNATRPAGDTTCL